MSAGLLCLSHSETCRDQDGNDVAVRECTPATAFDDDVNEQGNRDDLIASGTVEAIGDRAMANAAPCRSTIFLELARSRPSTCLLWKRSLGRRSLANGPRCSERRIWLRS